MNQAVRRGLSVCEREILRQQRERERDRKSVLQKEKGEIYMETTQKERERQEECW